MCVYGFFLVFNLGSFENYVAKFSNRAILNENNKRIIGTQKLPPNLCWKQVTVSKNKNIPLFDIQLFTTHRVIVLKSTKTVTIVILESSFVYLTR